MTTAPSARTVVAIGSVITVSFMGSVLVTPLYPLYQRQFGFSEVTLTLVYAVYVVGNVLALLLFGQVSDQIGRKRAVVPALVLAAASAGVFVLASGTGALFAGRLLIGLAVGVASGTATAWLAEEYGADRATTATTAAAVANMAGIGLGPLVGGLLAAYAPAPLLLPFVVYVAAIAAVAAAVSRVSERHPAQVSRLADVALRPRIGVPAPLLPAFAPPALTGFVTFGLGGLYFALIPEIVLRDLRIGNVAVAGAVVGELGLVAVLGILLGRRLAPRSAATAGLLLILPAVGLVVAAQAAHSVPLLLAAAAAAGATMAWGTGAACRR